MVAPMLVLLVVFVLWAGRSGRAGLVADLAAEEAATVAALCCEEGDIEGRERVVAEVLGARPGLDYLCIGGVRPVGERFVSESSVYFDPSDGGSVGGVGVLGVGVECVTDGAVAPLRGLFPVVTFEGRAAEVVRLSSPLGASGLPTLQVDDARASEGDGHIIFDVWLHQAQAADVSVSWWVAQGGEATAGVDYAIVSGVVTVFSGTRVAEVRVPLIDDVLDEPEETFLLVLGNPSGVSLDRLAAVGTIVDNDPLVGIDVVGATVTEGDGVAAGVVEFVVRLVDAVSGLDVVSGQVVRFDYETVDGTAVGGVDYVAERGSAQIAPGDTEFTVEVELVGDVVHEAHEYFSLRVFGVMNALPSSVTAQGSVLDDDPPVLWISDAFGVEGAGTIVFRVGLTALRDPPGDVRFWYRTLESGGDAVPGSVCLLPGVDFVEVPETDATLSAASSWRVDLPVQICNDGVPEHENGETFTLQLERADANAALLPEQVPGHPDDNDGVGTIFDPGAMPRVFVDDVKALENAGSMVFLVRLSHATSGDVDVWVRTVPGSARSPEDYSAQSHAVRITAGELSAEFEVPLIDDNVQESAESFRVVLSAPSPNAVLGPDADAVGTIRDDDWPPLVRVAGPVRIREGETGMFVVSLSWPSLSPIVVPFGFANGTATRWDGVATSGYDYHHAVPGTASVTIPAGDTTGRIPVHAIEDGIDEDFEERFSVNLGTVTGGIVTVGTAEGIIEDIDDPPWLTVRATNPTVEEGESAEFVLTLVDEDGQSTPSGRDISVEVSTRDIRVGDDAATGGDDYVAIDPARPVLFSSGETVKRVWVATIDDTLDELLRERFQFVVSASDPTTVQLVAPVVVQWIADNDDPPEVTVRATSDPATVNEGERAWFVVELSAESGLDVAVQVYTVDGSAVAGTVGTPGDYVALNQTVTIDAGHRSETVPVDTTDDALGEDDETFSVELSQPPAGFEFNAVLGDPSTAEVTILDDDLAVEVADAAAREGEPVEFTVSLENGALAPPGGASVIVSTRDLSTGSNLAAAGEDYTARAGDAATDTVTILEGRNATTFTVDTTGDDAIEGDETFQVVLHMVDVSIKGNRAAGTIVNDDTVITITDAEATEGEAVTFTVTATPALSDVLGDTLDVTVGYSTETSTGDDAATPAPLPDADYTPSPANATVTIDPVTIDAANPAAATATFTVDTLPDTLDENDETFLARLANPTIGQLDPATATATGTILDDPNDLAPLLNINDPPAVTEGGTITFTITLSDESGRDVAFTATTYRLYADSITAALPGEDYTHRPPTPLTIAAGATTTTFTVDTLVDTLDEADYETFGVRLRPATSGDDAVRFARGGAVGIGTIADDDDRPTLTVTADNAEVTEGDLAHFTITLSGTSGREVTAQARTFDETAVAGDDYHFTTRQIQFPPGDGDRTATVSVRTIDDPDGEADETFRLALVGTQNADASLPATVTIADDDVALNIADAEAVEGDPLRFLVTLNATTDERITVDWATRDLTGDGSATSTGAGYDYTAASGTLTFEPGDEFGTITVQTRADSLGETDERFQVVLTNPINARVPKRFATGTILDNGPRELTIVGDTVTEGETLTFTLTLDQARNEPTEIELIVRGTYGVIGVANVSDYFWPDVASVTIPAGETEVTFEVRTHDDDLAEDTEVLVLFAEVSVGTFFDDTRPGVGLIEDNDELPALSVTGPGTVVEGDTATFTVTLDNPSDRRVSMQVETRDGTTTEWRDYTPFQRRVNFARGVQERTIEVATTEDTTAESDETFTLQFTAIESATLATVAYTVTIVDDDTGLSIADAEAVEGDDLEFTVTLGVASSQPVTVDYTTRDGTATGFSWYLPGFDYTTTSDTLTFAPGVQEFTIPVPTFLDTETEGYETLELVLSNPTAGVTVQDGTATGIIRDDGNTRPEMDVYIRGCPDCPRGTVAEGETAEVILRLDRPSTELLGFRFWTDHRYKTRIDATEYHDFRPLFAHYSTVVFRPGETEVVVHVETIQDNLDEVDERISLALSTGSMVPAPRSSTRWFREITIVDDDLPPVVSVEGPGEVTEGDPAVFRLRLSEPSGRETSVQLDTISGSATSPGDFVRRSRRVIFPQTPPGPGVAELVIVVPTVDDGVGEALESFSLRLSSPEHLTLSAEETEETVVIVDDDVVVSVRDTEALEGEPLRFEVVLGAPRREDVTVNWETRELSTAPAATAGADFRADSGTVTIDAGYTSGFFTVDSVPDDDVEGDERFEVRLLSAVGAPLGDVIGIGTIVDDDTTVSVQGASAAEGAPVRFVVRLSNPLSRGFSVAYATEDLPAPGAATAGDDYEATIGWASFFAGATEVEVAVPTFSDDEDEAEERFGLRLTSTGMGSLVAPPTAEGIIVNATLPVLSVEAPEPVDEGAEAPFTLRLSAESSEPVTVRVSTAARPGSLAATPGVDFEELSEFEVTVPAGQTEVVFSVQTIDDEADEFDIEYFWVNLLPLAADAAAVLGDRRARGSIADNDDAPTLTVTATGEVVEGATVTFTLRLSRASERPIDVSYATAGHAEGATVWAATPTRLACADVPADARGDFEHASGTVTFVPGDPLQETIEVNTCDDMTTEGDGTPARDGIVEAFTLNARFTDLVNIAADAAATVRILDNDPLPEVRILDAGRDVVSAPYDNIAEAPEGEDLVFELQLDRRSELLTVVEGLHATGGTPNPAKPDEDFSYVSRPIWFTFPATTAEFRIQTNRDPDSGDSPTERLILRATSVNHINTVAEGHGTIHNRPFPSIRAGGYLSVWEGEDTAERTLHLSEPLSEPLTLSYWTMDRSQHATAQSGYEFWPQLTAQADLDYVAVPRTAPKTVTFDIGVTEATIEIELLDDQLLETSEGFIITVDIPPEANVVPAYSSALQLHQHILDNEWQAVDMTHGSTTLMEGESITVTPILSWRSNITRFNSSAAAAKSGPATAARELVIDVFSVEPRHHPSSVLRFAPAATESEDFTLSSSVVTIAIGSSTGTPSSITIQAVDDSEVEPTECFVIRHIVESGPPFDDYFGLPYGLLHYGYTDVFCIEDND